MSWHFLPEAGEGFLEANSLDGAPAALLRLIPDAGKFFSPDSVTEPSTSSQSGRTCAPSTDVHGRVLSTSSTQGFRARESLRQALVAASLTSHITEPLGESLARYDRHSCSWKTPRFLFQEDSADFSETWPRWGMMQGGECWERTPPDFHITEPASGWLPTPSGVNGGKNHTMGRVDEWGGSSNPLRGLPIGKALSPNFEEIVMGWPIDWTAQTPLEMARFQQWLDSHGKPSSPDSMTTNTKQEPTP